MVVEEIPRIVDLEDEGKELEEGDTSAVRLEYRSQYTAMTRYSEVEWVPAADFLFLVGQARVLSVRVAAPAGATTTWRLPRSGTTAALFRVMKNTGTGNQFDFTPAVTVAQRPITGLRTANRPVRYQIKATVVKDGVTQEKVETIEKDERDIILLQEWVDFRTWRNGFTLHVPYRTRISMRLTAPLSAATTRSSSTRR